MVNNGDDVHDLVLETGQRTARLSPGQRATIDVGVVGRSLDGWCSVAGHRQMGMVLSVEAIGGTDAALAAADEMPAGTMATAAHLSTDRHRGSVDLMAEPGPDAATTTRACPRPRPPACTGYAGRDRGRGRGRPRRPADPMDVRRHRARTRPARTVGDNFVVTLVNDGSIGHSIDFHAGALAPDGPMRTIAPGESLEYRFTATRAGIWMYHCSTMPMSMHIANGMFGAVIIDPPDLAPVDREYVLVQSESYLGPQAGTAYAAKIAAGEHDLVAFNGYPMQYDHHPLTATVGDRVRIWVLAAGPNVGSSFHVVGGQFDTVYREGAYDLLPGAGGSQVLGLFPAQGGFVELDLPEAGTTRSSRTSCPTPRRARTASCTSSMPPERRWWNLSVRTGALALVSGLRREVSAPCWT